MLQAMHQAPSSKSPENTEPGPRDAEQPNARLSIVLAIVAAVLLGVLGIGWGARTGYEVWTGRAFAAEDKAIDAILKRWEKSAPADIDPHVWREVVVVVSNATGNVCFTHHQVPVAEMRRLRAEIEAQDRQPITLDTLGWLYHRLGQTGPEGQRYIVRMQPLWDEARAAAEQTKLQFMKPE